MIGGIELNLTGKLIFVNDKSVGTATLHNSTGCEPYHPGHATGTLELILICVENVCKIIKYNKFMYKHRKK